MAEREQHMGDIYDLNPTTWSIWLVQNTIATRMGRWAAQNVSQQRALSFEYLYRWLEAEHARDVTRILLDPSTRLVLHRYKLPFKTKMAIPPPRHELFKWRKGGRRLSDWMVNGGFAPLCSGIIELEPPKLVAPPPLQSTRESARAGLWCRVAARGAALRRMSHANDDGDDAHRTRQVVSSVMHESREGNGNGARPPPPPDERPCIPAWLHCSNLMIAELDAQPEAPTASVFDGIDDPLQRVVEGLRRIEAAEAMDLWHEPMP